MYISVIMLHLFQELVNFLYVTNSVLPSAPNIIASGINSEVSYVPNFNSVKGAAYITSDGRENGDWRGVDEVTSNQYFTWIYYGINASRSSSIYGRADTIRPQSKSCKFFIRY